jgi:hypothetical protein
MQNTSLLKFYFSILHASVFSFLHFQFYLSTFLITPLHHILIQSNPIVSDQALSRKEQRIHDTTASSWGNPARSLERKIEHLARVLNCTEEEATHLFLHNL